LRENLKYHTKQLYIDYASRRLKCYIITVETFKRILLVCIKKSI